MNPIIVPIAALVVAFLKSQFNIEIEQTAVETTINVVLAIIIGIGIKMNPKKKETVTRVK